jgi:hypothetical protein
MVLFLFVIMLMDLRSTELAAHRGPKMRVLGVVLSLVFLVTVIYAIHHAATHPPGVLPYRLSAVLRLPAPPAVASEDPTQPEREPPTPPAQTVVLARKGDAWQGNVIIDGKPQAISVVPEYEKLLTRPLKHQVGTGEFAQSFPLGYDDEDFQLRSPLAPDGTELGIVVQRGGLAAHAGGGPDGSARAMGKSIFEEWLLPFEVVSLLLTGAIFGTVVLTKRRLA